MRRRPATRSSTPRIHRACVIVGYICDCMRLWGDGVPVILDGDLTFAREDTAGVEVIRQAQPNAMRLVPKRGLRLRSLSAERERRVTEHACGSNRMQ
jgi:hypothetical protein